MGCADFHDFFIFFFRYDLYGPDKITGELTDETIIGTYINDILIRNSFDLFKEES